MKKSTTRILALLLCCVLLLAVAACNKDKDKGGTNAGNTPAGTSNSGGNAAGNTTNPGGNQPGNQPASAKDTISIAISGDSGTLRANAIMGGFVGIIRNYQEPLYDTLADGTPVYVLATDIEEGTDEWIIHLRKDVTFSNGNKFDATDVMFSFDLYVNSPYGNMFLSTFDWENCRIIDEYTVYIKIANYSIQQMGSLCQVYMFDAETYDEDALALNTIGTGPYVATEYVTNSHLYFTARDDYWGVQPKIKNVQYRIFNEDAQIVNALKAGLVDVASVPIQDIDYVKTLPEYNVTTYSSVFAATMNFNMNSISVMNNLDARLAVCYAADRQAMVNLVYFGYATVLDYPVSENCYDYDPALSNLHPTYSVGHNYDRAKEHAEKAGLVGKDVVVITNGSPTYMSEAEILQDNMKKIGVNVIINNYDGATYMSVSQDPTMFDIAMYAAASPQSLAIGMLYDYCLWGAAQYADGWPEYWDFIALGRTGVSEINMDARKGILKEMSVMFEDACPWYGICDMMSAVAINKDLSGIIFYNSGGMNFNEWYWV